MLGLDAGICQKNPSSTIREVTNKNCVAPYFVDPKLKQAIYIQCLSQILFFQTANLTASHPNNRANARWLFRDSSHTQEIFVNFQVVSVLDCQSMTPWLHTDVCRR